MLNRIYGSIFIVAIIAMTCVNIHVMTSHMTKVDAELKKIDVNIAHSNNTVYAVMDAQERIMHYIAGHTSDHTAIYCPECGMIEQLVMRQAQIYDQTYQLSEFIAENANHETVPEKNKKLTELTHESANIAKFLFNADETAKRLQKLKEKQ